MRVGVIGLGRMGHAIAERLVELGPVPVVWNRTPGKAAGLAGVVEATSPADLAARSDVILSVLADDAAIEAVYGGPGGNPEGLCSADLAGKVVVEFCTTAPATARALEARVAAVAGMFLECPVGGTVGPARNGQLLGLAGGSEAAFEAARPVLERLTRRLEHLGPVGRGSAMKLAINLPLMVYWAALGEALGLALAEGVDPGLALDILTDSSGAIGAAKARVPPIRDVLLGAPPGAANFRLAGAIKDMRLMEALAAATGQPAPVIEAARARAEAAATAGFADLDASFLGLFGKIDRR